MGESKNSGKEPGVMKDTDGRPMPKGLKMMRSEEKYISEYFFYFRHYVKVPEHNLGIPVTHIPLLLNS